MLAGKIDNGINIERIAERVRKYDGPGSIGKGQLQLTNIHIKGGKRYVDEYGHQAVLEDGIDRGRKAGGDGNDFVSRSQPLIGQLWGRQSGEGHKICG